MSVPDAVIFRPALDSGQLTYGAVRKLQEEEQLRALQRRFGKFFISQVAELAKPEGNPSVCISPQMWIESDSVLVRKVRRITHVTLTHSCLTRPCPWD